MLRNSRLAASGMVVMIKMQKSLSYLEMTSSLVSFLFISVSLLIYFLSARVTSSQNREMPPDSFFIAKEEISKDEFAGAQVSYALQMQTVIPFFAWGFLGEWWLAAWNTIFYMIGIFLLVILINRFQDASTFIKGSGSMHDAIGSIHRSSQLRKISAWMTIVSFSGLTLFELVSGARVFLVLFEGNRAIYLFSVLLLALFMLSYLYENGQPGAIKTDQYQLLLGYVGLFLAAAWIIHKPAVKVNALDAPILFLLVAAGCIIVFGLRAMLIKKADKSMKYLHSITLGLMLILFVSILCKPGSLSHGATVNLISSDGVSVGWKLALLSVMPLLFQFVDMTNWQRIKSLKPTESQQKGLLIYLIESPLSWIIPIILGICASKLVALNNQNHSNPWNAFVTLLLKQNDPIGMIVCAFFMVSILAIFMSTADGLITAIGYAYTYDINDKTRTIIRQPSKSVSKNMIVRNYGRWAMIASVIFVVFGFILAEGIFKSEDMYIGLLLSFYSPMISFAPSILMPIITGRTAPEEFAITSLLGGGLSGIVIGIYGLTNPGIANWIGALVAIVLSWLVYILGVLLDGRKWRIN